MTRNIRCLAIDDEPIALEKLHNYIRKVPYLEPVAACESAVEAMKVMSNQEIDAIFADINMPDLNGLDFIRSLTKRPLVVFTTAHTQYAVDSYSVSPVDYLLKPFSFADFQRAANRILQQFTLLSLKESSSATTASPSDSLYVKVEYKYVRIDLKDIRYIEGMSDYLRIYLVAERKPLITHSTFKSIKEYLSPNFLQVHRSYIVNMDRLKEISRYRIMMDEETWIPVGDIYKEEFTAYLKQRSVGNKQSQKSSPE